MTIGLTERIGQ
jgi:hypothetical protein